MNNGAAPCFAHNHLTPAEYGLYVLLRELSSKNNFKYNFDDRALARRFAHGCVSRQTINRLRRSLERKGFIRWETALKRVAGQGFESRVGTILSHKEVAALHPNRCPAMLADEHDQCSQVSNLMLTDEQPNAHRCDIKEIEATLIETDRCSSAAPPPSSGNAPLLKSDPDAQCSPVSVGGSEQCSPVSIGGSVSELARLMQAHVSVRQLTDALPNLDIVHKLSLEQARSIFQWAVADPFWDGKLSGASALRTFCKHLPTILKQQRSAEARQRQGKTSTTKRKAASVAPVAGFQYAGGVL